MSILRMFGLGGRDTTAQTVSATTVGFGIGRGPVRFGISNTVVRGTPVQPVAWSPGQYYAPASTYTHYPLYGSPEIRSYDPYAFSGRSAPGYAFIPSTTPFSTPRPISNVPGYLPQTPVAVGLRGSDGRHVDPTNAGRPENAHVTLTPQFRGSDGRIHFGTPADDRRLSSYYNRPPAYDPRDFRGGMCVDPFSFGYDMRPAPRDTMSFALANSMFGMMRHAMEMDRARALSMPDNFRDARRDVFGTGSVSDMTQLQGAYQRATYSPPTRIAG